MENLLDENGWKSMLLISSFIYFTYIFYFTLILLNAKQMIDLSISSNYLYAHYKFAI